MSPCGHYTERAAINDGRWGNPQREGWPRFRWTSATKLAETLCTSCVRCYCWSLIGLRWDGGSLIAWVCCKAAVIYILIWTINTIAMFTFDKPTNNYHPALPSIWSFRAHFCLLLSFYLPTALLLCSLAAVTYAVGSRRVQMNPLHTALLWIPMRDPMPLPYCASDCPTLIFWPLPTSLLMHQAPVTHTQMQPTENLLCWMGECTVWGTMNSSLPVCSPFAGSTTQRLRYWLRLRLRCPKFTKVEVQVKPRCRSAWPPDVNVFCCCFLDLLYLQVLILCMCARGLNPNQPKQP